MIDSDRREYALVGVESDHHDSVADKFEEMLHLQRTYQRMYNNRRVREALVRISMKRAKVFQIRYGTGHVTAPLSSKK